MTNGDFRSPGVTFNTPGGKCFVRPRGNPIGAAEEIFATVVVGE